MDRRAFLGIVGMAGAGLALLPRVVTAQEYLAHRRLHLRSGSSGGTSYIQATIGTGSNIAGGYGWCLGLYATNEDGTFAQDSGFNGGMNAMTNSFYLRNEAAGKLTPYNGSTALTAQNFSEGDVVRIERNGSTFTLKQNGSVVYTWAATYSGTIRAVITGPYTIDLYKSVSWSNAGTVTNSTSGKWAGSTANFGFSGADISVSSAGHAIYCTDVLN